MYKTNVYNDTSVPITVDIEKLSAMLCCGHQTARKIGEEAHATVRINRRVLYSVDKVKDYINNMTE